MIIYFSMPLFSLQIRVSVRWQPFLTVFTRHPSPRMISGCCPTVSEIEFFRAVRPSADHSASSSSESFVRWNIRSRIRPSPPACHDPQHPPIVGRREGIDSGQKCTNYCVCYPFPDEPALSACGFRIDFSSCFHSFRFLLVLQI